MLVIITHPKYFDKEKLKRKKVELCYIFNSKRLYNELSKKYKCVNLNSQYEIIDENFFPSETYDGRLLYPRMFSFRISILTYFYKKKYQLMKRKGVAAVGAYYKRDAIYNMSVAMAKKTFKRDKSGAMRSLNDSIYSVVQEGIYNIVSKSYFDENKEYFPLIFNLADSFYRSYIYSFPDVKRGAEVTSDVLKYNFVMNSIIYYRMEKNDIYKDGFHYNYLRVLSRLFIENIHRNLGIKEFTYENIEFWEED